MKTSEILQARETVRSQYQSLQSDTDSTLKLLDGVLSLGDSSSENAGLKSYDSDTITPILDVAKSSLSNYQTAQGSLDRAEAAVSSAEMALQSAKAFSLGKLGIWLLNVTLTAIKLSPLKTKVERAEENLTANKAALKEERNLCARAKEIALQDAQKVTALAPSILPWHVKKLNDLNSQFEQNCISHGVDRLGAWTHSAWSNFSGNKSSAVLSEIRIGEMSEQTLPGENPLSFAPKFAKLLSSNGAILVKCDASTAKLARNLIQSIALRASIAMRGDVKLTLIDPETMGAAFPFRGLLDNVRPSEAGGAGEQLNQVLADIFRINETVIGAASKFSDLSPEQRTGEFFDLIAVSDFPGAFQRDPRAVDQIVKIANSGPRAGRLAIIEWHEDQELPHDFNISQFKNSITLDIRKLSRECTLDELPDSAEWARIIEVSKKSDRNEEVGDWDSVVRPVSFFAESSQKRIETPLGARLNMWFGEADDGQSCSHGILVGQIGSGKSVMLHVLITGLATRYSPDQLRISLIDLKQGVEFEPYKELPHVDSLCLNADPALARSIIDDMHNEMTDRYVKFRSKNVQRLSDYVKLGGEMPRTLLIIDEYQRLFEADGELDSEFQRKFNDILRLGRAAGTHLLLSSQEPRVAGASDSAAMDQIQLVASLYQNESSRARSDLFENEGRRMVGELATTGQAVISHQSGRDKSNTRGAVARMRLGGSDATVPTVIREINALTITQADPVVLDGSDAALISDNPFVMRYARELPVAKELQEVARKSWRDGGFAQSGWTSGAYPLPLWWGREFNVHAHALSVLNRAQSQNVVCLGANANTRNMMIASSLAALSSMMKPSSVSVHVQDGLIDGALGGGHIRAATEHLKSNGFSAGYSQSTQDLSALSEFIEGHFQRYSEGETLPSSILVISEPELFPSLYGAENYWDDSEQEANQQLMRAIKEGPQKGLHTLISASGATTLSKVISTRDLNHFNHVVTQKMKEEDAMLLFSNLKPAKIDSLARHAHACLLADMLDGFDQGRLFHSYAASRNTHEAEHQTSESLASEFSKLQKEPANVT